MNIFDYAFVLCFFYWVVVNVISGYYEALTSLEPFVRRYTECICMWREQCLLTMHVKHCSAESPHTLWICCCSSNKDYYRYKGGMVCELYRLAIIGIAWFFKGLFCIQRWMQQRYYKHIVTFYLVWLLHVNCFVYLSRKVAVCAFSELWDVWISFHRKKKICNKKFGGLEAYFVIPRSISSRPGGLKLIALTPCKRHRRNASNDVCRQDMLGLSGHEMCILVTFEKTNLWWLQASKMFLPKKPKISKLSTFQLCTISWDYWRGVP